MASNFFDRFAVRSAVGKDAYKASVEQLRRDLLQQQFALAESGQSLILLIAGLDGAGKGVLVHRLNEWMDPRRIQTNTFWDPSDEEDERPYFWRFWRHLPARGHSGIFLGTWYRRPIQQYLLGETGAEAMADSAQSIRQFERQLSAGGAIVVKLWLHVSEATQRRQLEEEAPAREQNPRVSDHPYELYGRYQETLDAAEQLIRQTQSSDCPWHIVDAEERRGRELTAGEIILDSLRRRLGAPANGHTAEPPSPAPDHLGRVPLERSLDRDDYQRQLRRYQGRLQDLVWQAYREQRSLVVAFEGWDAAGKGSAIRRVTSAIDPRLYQLTQIAAPSDEEAAQHYLWRFWRRLQRDGRAALFDRSWYGRVLVERVEGFARAEEWQRAYAEINEFERELTAHGSVVVKFWIHISPEEQLARFRAREQEPHKRYKITDEDWRNREKWPAYAEAINQMVERTDTPDARWHLVAGNDKLYARVRILKVLCKTLAAALQSVPAGD